MILQEGQGYQVSIQGISKTVQIDYKKKSRIFQNVNKTYQEIMREALKDTVGAGIRFYASDRKIEVSLYQIEETDWEFIRRLASHLNVLRQKLLSQRQVIMNINIHLKYIIAINMFRGLIVMHMRLILSIIQ